MNSVKHYLLPPRRRASNVINKRVQQIMVVGGNRMLSYYNVVETMQPTRTILNPIPRMIGQTLWQP